jgi:hypothetical protein
MQVYKKEHCGLKPEAPNAKLCKLCYGELTKDVGGKYSADGSILLIAITHIL